MRKMYWPILLLFLGLLVFSTPVLAASLSGSETSFAADVFSGGVEQITNEPKQEQSTSFLGPGLLLIGIILLAASGRQYAGQFTMANAELQNLREGLDTLVDDSVRVDGGQHEGEHARMESLKATRDQLKTEHQVIRGGV